jgi:predicted amidohydrolase YtcJ
MNCRRIFIPIIFLLALHSCANKTQVDQVLHNGTIYTVDETFSTAEAMAIKNGRILATGKANMILGKYAAAEIIDLEGGFAYPGLIDAHCHFIGYGESLQNADLTGTGSFEEIIEILKENQAKYPSDWILGRGWDQNDWKIKEFPTKDKLDHAFPGKPVLLTRIDGHGDIASTEGLRRGKVIEERGTDKKKWSADRNAR